jgi:hypothetical protein
MLKYHLSICVGYFWEKVFDCSICLRGDILLASGNWLWFLGIYNHSYFIVLTKADSCPINYGAANVMADPVQVQTHLLVAPARV